MMSLRVRVLGLVALFDSAVAYQQQQAEVPFKAGETETGHQKEAGFLAAEDEAKPSRAEGGESEIARKTLGTPAAQEGAFLGEKESCANPGMCMGRFCFQVNQTCITPGGKQMLCNNCRMMGKNCMYQPMTNQCTFMGR